MTMKVKITKTSANSATVEPIVLHETTTTRLVLKAMLVNNQQDIHQPVRGDLLWQRRKPSGDGWDDEANLHLSTMKAGSGVKLALGAGELHRLTSAVRGLYGLFWAKGKRLPNDGEEFNLLDYAQVAKTLDTVDAAAKAIETAGEKGLVEVLQHVASSKNTAQLLKALPLIDSVDLAKINTFSGVELLKKAHQTWMESSSNTDESFWHDMLVKYSFVLSQVFSAPVTIFKSKAYVGGKNIDGVGGKLPDFLMKHQLTKHVLIVEIKTPQTQLLHPTVYRKPDVFAVSREVAGAIGQIVKYKAELLHNYSELLRKAGEERFLLADPRCLVVIGDMHQLQSDNERDSFEHFRRGQRGTEIITFDELFEKIKLLIELLEGSDPVAAPS